ncbi:hypothetical protein ACIBF7_10560 [Nonomuraea sp. NPDC050478]|uniref:hypothetical protein n=1 Tax=Nonomuraea sp. NPDC050478 TaxID=3364365 RepID=UPI0037AD8516
MITVVGVGADGRDGLPADSRRTVEAAEVLRGAPRQLDLVPASAAERGRDAGDRVVGHQEG